MPSDSTAFAWLFGSGPPAERGRIRGHKTRTPNPRDIFPRRLQGYSLVDKDRCRSGLHASHTLLGWLYRMEWACVPAGLNACLFVRPVSFGCMTDDL